MNSPMIIEGTRAADRATELVLAYYSAFNRGDWGAMLELLAEDVVHDINQGGREIGKEAFEEFLERMDRCYREQVRDIVILANAEGDRIAAEFTVHGQYLQDDSGLPPARGQSYILAAGAFFAIEDGRICRVTNYYNLEDWVAQVTRTC